MVTLQNLSDYCEANNIDLFEGCTVPAPLDMTQVINNIKLRCGLLPVVYSEPQVFKMMARMWFDSNQWNFEHLVNIILAEYNPIENVVDHDWWKEEHSGTDKRSLGGDDKIWYGKVQTLGGSDTLTHGEVHTLGGSDTLTHGETHTLSGSDTLTHGETHTLSGTDSVSDTTSNEHTVSAYNSSGYQADTKDTTSGGPATTYGKTDTASGQDTTGYGKTDTASGMDTTGYGKTDTASGCDTTEYNKTDDLEHGENIEYHRYRHANVGVTTNQQLINQELELLEKFNIYDWIAHKFERDNMIQCY